MRTIRCSQQMIINRDKMYYIEKSDYIRKKFKTLGPEYHYSFSLYFISP